MTRVYREFHPVGHGAFFTERLCDEGRDDIIVVYDCGCKEKEEMKLLTREVNAFFHDGEKIDILFISHFDTDHVSGIKLLMPYLSDKTRLLMPFSYDYFYLDTNSPIMQYMGQTLNLIEDTQLSIKQYWVRYSEEETSLRLIDYRELLGSFVESGTRLGAIFEQTSSFRYKWMYVPFNMYNDIQYKRQFEQEVAAKLGKQPADINPAELDSKTIESLRAIYKRIGRHDTDTPKPSTNASNGSKNINENSLLVLSKSATNGCRQRTWTYLPFYLCKSYHLIRYDGSCLYTGDSNLSTDKALTQLKSLLASYVSQPVFLFQLPHHGSRQYYSIKLLEDFDLCSYMFVNCGDYDFKQNSFPQLLSDIVSTGRTARFITNMEHCRFKQILLLY